MIARLSAAGSLACCAGWPESAGLRSVIISRGQSALHFSSASLDLLSALPNGDNVTDVAQGLQQLAEQLPEHPYSRLGAEAVLEYATQTEALLTACGR